MYPLAQQWYDNNEGNAPLSSGTWGLLHKKNFISGSVNLVKSLWLGSSQALRGTYCCLMWNSEAVKLPPKYFMFRPKDLYGSQLWWWNLFGLWIKVTQSPSNYKCWAVDESSTTFPIQGLGNIMKLRTERRVGRWGAELQNPDFSTWLFLMSSHSFCSSLSKNLNNIKQVEIPTYVAEEISMVDGLLRDERLSF